MRDQHRSLLRRWAVAALTLLTVSTGCGGGGGGGMTSPTAPPIPTAGTGSAVFRIIGPDGTETSYSFGSNNLVRCSTNAGFASLFIRLSRDRIGDGANAPHIDMDVCNHQLVGAFDPKSPQDATCGTEPTFDIFWHEEDGTVYSNEITSPCLLELTGVGADNSLMGMFSCSGLTEFGGTRSVDVLDGVFECIVE